MGFYISKPVKIEARQYAADDTGLVTRSLLETATELIDWILENGGTARYHAPGDPDVTTDKGFLVIDTLEGSMQAKEGDWIIKGLIGEFYPCTPNVFEQKYERVVG